MITRLTATLVLALAISAAVAAHEFWISAASWRVPPGQRATILVNVGDRFPSATSFTAPERVESVRLVGPTGETPIPGPFRREKDSLAADVQAPGQPGTYIAVVTIKPRVLEIKASDFETYLAHEGLDGVVAERRRAGESGKPGRERYSRYGKTLLRVGDATTIGHVTRPVGLAVEIVPLTDPTTLRAGDRCRFRLLFEGKPIAGAKVGAIYASATTKPDEWPLTARTDARGEVEFTLNDPGPWLVRAVHMVRRTEQTGAEAADWESYWASLSFALDAASR